MVDKFLDFEYHERVLIHYFLIRERQGLYRKVDLSKESRFYAWDDATWAAYDYGLELSDTKYKEGLFLRNSLCPEWVHRGISILRERTMLIEFFVAGRMVNASCRLCLTGKGGNYWDLRDQTHLSMASALSAAMEHYMKYHPGHFDGTEYVPLPGIEPGSTA